MYRILKLTRQNKKLLLLILGIVFVLTFIPFQSARADWISDLIGGILAIPVAIFELPFTLAINSALAIALFSLVIIFNLFSGFMVSAFALVVALTEWLIHTSMNIGVIPGADTTPGVVVAGWEFTLGFVNMLFILILAFYGLATILRIRDYDIRKMLPKVLAIAILVNFTPVIVGLIVDAGNITTDFFMKKALESDIIGMVLGNESAGTGIWGKVVKPAINDAMGAITGDFFQDPSTTIGLFIQAVGPLVVAIIFLILACLIYLMVAFVFLMRIVMLWLLMILAPIAFFSYVVPDKAPITSLFPDILLWKRWWEEFIRWVIVGIPFGLFLYIASSMLEHSDNLLPSGSDYTPPDLNFTIGTMELSIGPLFTAILTVIPFMLPLVVLYTGYKIGTKAAPSAAQGIIKGVTGAAKTGAMMVATGGAAAVGATVGGAMAGSAAAGVSGVSSRAQRLDEWAGRRRFLKPIAKPLTKAAVLATRGAERTLVPRLRKAEAEMKKEKITEGFGDMKGEAKKDVYMAQLTAGNRLAHGAKMKTSELAKSAATDEGFRKKLSEDVKSKAGDKDYSEDIDKIKKAIPDIIDEKILVNLEPDKVKKDKLVDAINDEVKKMDEEVDEKDITIEAALKYKIITQDEVDKNGKAVLEKAKKGIKEKDIDVNQFKRDTAAAAITIGKAKPADVGEYSDITLKSFAARRGSRKWHGGHLAKVREKHDKDTIEDFFEKPGGINTVGINELEEENSRLAQHLVVHPTGREWGYKGRKEMMEMEGGKYKTEDQYGRIRPNYDRYKADKERRGEVRGPSEIISEIAQHEKDLKELEGEEKALKQKGARGLPREKRKKLTKARDAIPSLELELDKIQGKEKKEAISSLLSDEEIQKKMFYVSKDREKGEFDTYPELQEIKKIKIPESPEREKALKEGRLREWDRKMAEKSLREKYSEQIEDRSAGLTKKRRKGQPGYGDARKAVTGAGFKPDTKEAERFMVIKNQRDAIKELEEETVRVERKPVKRFGAPETIIGEITRQEKQAKELEEELQKEALSFSEKRKAGEFDTNPELLEIRKEPDIKRRDELEREWDWKQAEEELKKEYKTDTRTKIERIKKAVDLLRKDLEETQQKEIKQALDALVSKEEIEEEAFSFSEKRKSGEFDTNPELLEIRKEPDIKRRDELEREWDYRKTEEEMRKKYKEKIGERIVELQEYSSKGELGYGETWKAMTEEGLDPRNEEELKKFIEIKSQTGAIKEFKTRKEKIDRLAKENYYKRLIGKEGGFKKEDIDTALSDGQIDPADKPKTEDFLRKRDRNLAGAEYEKTQKKYEKRREERAYYYSDERQKSPEVAREFDELLERRGIPPLTDEAEKFGRALDWDRAGTDTGKDIDEYIIKKQEEVLKMPKRMKKRKGLDRTTNKLISDERKYFSTVKDDITRLKEFNKKIEESEKELASVEEKTPEDTEAILKNSMRLFKRKNAVKVLEEEIIKAKKELEKTREQIEIRKDLKEGAKKEPKEK